MTRTRLGQAATAVIALLALSGCNRIGSPLEVLSMKRSSPDEFQVIARKPLQMPLSASLPEPRPGAPSPLDPDPNRDAVVALLGADTRMAGRGASPGEQALLSAADAAATDPDIRRTLAAEGAGSADEPYEAPYLWELVGLGGSGPAARDALDAAAESRRLRSEGVAAAPVDPNDRPAPEEAEEVDVDPNAYPEIGAGGPPRNKLPSSQTTPAF